MGIMGILLIAGNAGSISSTVFTLALLQVADEEAQFFGTAANIGGFLLMGHYLACIWVPWPRLVWV